MISYAKQTSLDKPTVEVLKTSYNVQVFKNIVQLPNGYWQFDKDVYSIAEYSVIEQAKEKALVDEVNRLKSENQQLMAQTEELTNRISINDLTIDSILTEILPSLQ